jgi:formylglycine-generating enzyme required for sulfatase activity
VDSERPYHHINLQPFHIGQYPVTVGEYRCFVEAGGYEQAQYWETDDAQAWLGGADPAGGPVGRILRLRQRLLDSGRSLDEWAKEHQWKAETLESWQKWTAMSENEVRQDFQTIVPAHSRTQPVWWDDASRTGSNQPVIGVTWYEACAYCAWLADVSGRPFRLPTEIEWEAAMRGPDGRRYPWGEKFDPARANTLEGQVLGTTPVGLYPEGVSPFGVWDGAGNVWEWTSSLFGPYPYRADDGREDVTSADHRVLRGGSWFSPQEHCRCAFRDVTIPDLYSHYVGFRVAVS